MALGVVSVELLQDGRMLLTGRLERHGPFWSGPLLGCPLPEVDLGSKLDRLQFGCLQNDPGLAGVASGRSVGPCTRHERMFAYEEG